MRDWVEGFGYVKLWEQLHRAEETLILFTPLQTLIIDIWRDEQRLRGSNMDNRDVLLTRLHNAETVLTELSTGLSIRTLTDGFRAREEVRYVRRAINEYRDERRIGLVRARNRLIKTVALTGFVAFSVLVLAILSGAPDESVIAAVAFYLVGAIVGLFNQLHLDAKAETAIQDYGLSTARLLHTPLFSGLAALGGVLIIPMLSVLINPSNPGTTPQPLIPILESIFNLGTRPFGLVLAAIFGLSPAILISRLQQEAEQYKADLKSTESPSGR